ncbi:MAG: hypothetical protein QXK37_03275 [Candidatus Woesearchaeota archaeon]
MNRLKRIIYIKVMIYLLLMAILFLLFMEGTINTTPHTSISLENTTVLGKIIGG